MRKGIKFFHDVIACIVRVFLQLVFLSAAYFSKYLLCHGVHCEK